jgi:hypothetical protein
MTNQKTPDIDALYQVLREWAVSGNPKFYTDLSREYNKRTGDWFEPHGSWDIPLGELNKRLASIGAPALSALVILKEKKEPGGSFWGCASNVPPRPRNDIMRIAEWTRIVNAIYAYPWPLALP